MISLTLKDVPDIYFANILGQVHETRLGKTLTIHVDNYYLYVLNENIYRLYYLYYNINRKNKEYKHLLRLLEVNNIVFKFDKYMNRIEFERIMLERIKPDQLNWVVDFTQSPTANDLLFWVLQP